MNSPWCVKTWISNLRRPFTKGKPLHECVNWILKMYLHISPISICTVCIRTLPHNAKIDVESLTTRKCTHIPPVTHGRCHLPRSWQSICSRTWHWCCGSYVTPNFEAMTYYKNLSKKHPGPACEVPHCPTSGWCVLQSHPFGSQHFPCDRVRSIGLAERIEIQDQK